MVGGIRDEVLRDLQDSASMYLRMYEAERTSSAQLRSRADAADADVERLRAALERAKYYVDREAYIPAALIIDDALREVIARV
ncbi:hypothetical protein G5B47_02405 [Paenibacillus sp. 7124]|uniref:Uncharacterized protein n=1 Tax=Paenibacillus apii TaxID=1850370 RepID=A0A6M1PDB0_9BACL|nr:hypothetical protein [Paenibacillus apii]NGM81260.1 hypothetical protein [Paenibacillus apii]